MRNVEAVVRVDAVRVATTLNLRTPQEKESLQREIESTDKAIDKLVYELYGLTEGEIKVVEGKS